MATQTRLTDSEIESLLNEYPNLPATYLNYLRNIGWGVTPRGHMIYSGPISPDEIYPHLVEPSRVIIGDDMSGYCLGYDFTSKTFGEYSDSGEWSSFDEGFDLEVYMRGDDS